MTYEHSLWAAKEGLRGCKPLIRANRDNPKWHQYWLMLFQAYRADVKFYMGMMRNGV